MKLLLDAMPVFLMGSKIMEVAGPFEMQGSILAILQFVFTFGIIIGKKRNIRIIASFLSAITGGSALVVYLANQLSVGNPLSFGPIAIFSAGVVYGLLVGILMVMSIVRQKKLEKMTAEKIASQPPLKRRFED